MARAKIEEETVSFTVLSPESRQSEFAPWLRDERGQQVYIKLTRAEEVGYLATGEQCMLDAELHQCLLRLVNEGWAVQGELTVSFEGHNEPGVDPYVLKDPVTLELGQALLSLVDPQCNGPLLTALPGVRDEIARESGLVPPGVRIKDNLSLEPHSYAILIKNTPCAVDELFLDRYLAVGDFEQLSKLEGWSTVEPTYRMKAKWIEPAMRDKANDAGCMVCGALQVLMTHLKKVVMDAAPELLGLQDTFNLVSRLQLTHPVVVEDFMENRTNLRRLRHVMQELLRDNVSVGDLVTILETAGDNLANLENTAEIVEQCRLALSRQICFSLTSPEGILRGLSLDDDIEELLAHHTAIDDSPLVADGSCDQVDRIIRAIRGKLQATDNPPVIFTSPFIRPTVSRLLRAKFPLLTVLSTSEIAPGFHVEVAGMVTLKPENTDGFAAPDADADNDECGAAEENKNEPSSADASKGAPRDSSLPAAMSDTASGKHAESEDAAASTPQDGASDKTVADKSEATATPAASAPEAPKTASEKNKSVFDFFRSATSHTKKD